MVCNSRFLIFFLNLALGIKILWREYIYKHKINIHKNSDPEQLPVGLQIFVSCPLEPGTHGATDLAATPNIPSKHTFYDTIFAVADSL